MKNILTTLIIIISSSTAFAQVIIGDNIGTATNKQNVLLEFSKTQNKGLILPYVRTIPNTPTHGTILLDASIPTSAKVKYYNGSWVDLSLDGANISNALTNQPNNITERNDSKVIIGSNTTTANGVLVLESTTKVMVLPTVNTTDDIVNPSPGMMVYLAKDKMLAIYNGANWSFWASN